MTTSTKRIKVYSDSNARLPNHVLRALGADSWIQHAHVEVVATSKREAEDILRMHGTYPGLNGLTVIGKVDPEHGDVLGLWAEGLRDAGLLGPGSVGAAYAHGAQGGDGAVVDLTADGAPVVGRLKVGPRRLAVFTPALPPSEADQLRAAVALLDRLHPADKPPFGASAAAEHNALRLVLAAARTTLPREEN